MTSEIEQKRRGSGCGPGGAAAVRFLRSSGEDVAADDGGARRPMAERGWWR
jgi:hypothetical protein